MRRLSPIALAAMALAAPACKRDRDPPPAARSPVPLPPPLAGAPSFRIDAGPQTPCTAGAPCEARIVLSALGAYRVDPGYPVAFEAEPVPGVTVDGGGAFALDDARTGTLTLPFRAARPGPARLRGAFKLKVCAGERCELAEPRIELALPVGG